MTFQESQNATSPLPPAAAVYLEDAREAQTRTLTIEDVQAVPVEGIPGATVDREADLVVIKVSDKRVGSTGV